MRVLVLGGGAREHALVARLGVEGDVSEVVCAPGNAGIARRARCLPADLVSPAQLLDIASRERIDLTVVGPELPLSIGTSRPVPLNHLATDTNTRNPTPVSTTLASCSETDGQA